jgi:hypothetical protein
VALNETGDRIDQIIQSMGIFAILRSTVGNVGNRMAAHAQDRAIGEHHLQFFHMPACGAVAGPMAAAGVDRDDASHRGDAAHGGVGSEQSPALAQIAV